MFVLGDLMVFALFFGAYLAYRAEAPGLYAEAQRSLDLGVGLANTLALLTSSAALALGVKTARVGDWRAARPWVWAAILFGGLFIAGKIFEYGDKIASGYSVETGEFFMFFFMLTGIHFVHVLVGMVLLGLLITRLKPQYSEQDQRLLESGAVFWHMVDLLWIVLFTLFYLIR